MAGKPWRYTPNFMLPQGVGAVVKLLNTVPLEKKDSLYAQLEISSGWNRASGK